MIKRFGQRKKDLEQEDVNVPQSSCAKTETQMEKPHDVWENSRLAGATGCLCCVHYATALSELHLMGDIWILGRIWSTLVFCAEESEKKWKDKNSNKKLVPSCANVLYFTSF